MNLPKLISAGVKFGPMLVERISADMQRAVRPAPHRPDYAQWPHEGMHAAWVGHSTVMLQIDGFTIVTDPVLANRVGLNFGPVTLGMKRLVAPASTLVDLPRPELILLSHAHMDHFDVPTLRRLENKASTVVTAPNTSDLLRPRRYRGVRELAWGESTQVGPAKITAFQVKHWGARMQTDTQRGYNGYVIEVGRHRVVFGGDTAWIDTFRQLRAFGKVDVAIMPIGAYNPWIDAHCNPEQALAMANDAGADFVFPVHHQTFVLSQEPEAEPMERLLNAAADENRICVREIGQEFHLS